MLFVISIILLIIRPNLIRILLGWDGLGLVSFCLVIYYQNTKSLNAGILTALSNRIGDVAFLIRIAWILNFGRWNFIIYKEFIKDRIYIQIIAYFIILAAITKRAQIPFSSWLPAAIAAPTPVSALVHSSTLVTAGVYLIIRFDRLIKESRIRQFLLLIGRITIFISGLNANFEFDLKKIIALSTLSQLGLIIIILSINIRKLAFFHLLTHAIFKALLFMCAGSIIHNIINLQDIRLIGNIVKNIPLTVTFFNIANLALCGIPFLAGFYSKDSIIEYAGMTNLNNLIIFILYSSTGFTAIYSFRLVFYSITGKQNFFRNLIVFDNRIIIIKSKIILIFISIIRGSILSWIIFPTPSTIIIPMFLKIIVLIVLIMSSIRGYYLANIKLLNLNKSLLFNKTNWFIRNIWFLPLISTTYLYKYPIILTEKFKVIDQGWREIFGRQNIFSIFKKSSKLLYSIQSNPFKLQLIRFIVWTTLIFIIIIN